MAVLDDLCTGCREDSRVHWMPLWVLFYGSILAANSWLEVQSKLTNCSSADSVETHLRRGLRNVVIIFHFAAIFAARPDENHSGAWETLSPDSIWSGVCIGSRLKYWIHSFAQEISQICWKVVAKLLTTDVSSIQMISSAVKRYTK